jgi:hypothetical protein
MDTGFGSNIKMSAFILFKGLFVLEWLIVVLKLSVTYLFILVKPLFVIFLQFIIVCTFVCDITVLTLSGFTIISLLC